MRTVDTSISESLMFIRFAKLTPRFENDQLVVSTKDIAESYQERQKRDGELDLALATMVSHLRMCIWEANYVDWLATVIYRAKHSKFFTEPSKATKAEARNIAHNVSIRSDSKETTPGLEKQDQDSLTGLFQRACAELNRSESAVSEAIHQCINKKASKDSNEILVLEKTEQWGELYERIRRDTKHLKECIPTQFIPFQSYLRGALNEFTPVYFKECTLSWTKPGAGFKLAQKQSNENRALVQTGKNIEMIARSYDEKKRDMKENKQKVDVKSGGFKNKVNISRGLKA
ncbi:hypothetical protein L873DRAFT_597559 [Choiromyces venosus 120613-1]|uniref:Uncharacterized protein n=1 Tax=Choiromyces venosus 120613-1 TaxID=1336337 RepID=A0A3N4JXI8_9PEZI|nr:hypothetical protein L873DRAFT_597559 [Choiromyces venosus 120613-1]